MRCYFNVRSKADVSQLNLPHGTKTKNWKTEKVKKKKEYTAFYSTRTRELRCLNDCIGIHVLALTVLVSLQPINTQYSRDADAHDQ